MRDGDEQAGTVVSFTNGVLTIELAAGGRVSGRVTAATELECESEDEAEDHDRGGARSSSSGPGHDGNGGSSSGPGSGDGDDDSSSGRRGDDDGDDDGEHRNGGRRDRTCPGGTAVLVPGARVHEAELRLSSAGATWDEVELLR